MAGFAPKDAEKKRPFYYLMRNKQVFGMKTPKGTGCHVIYQNDNRLINASKITGNIEDEEILTLLKTAEGFKKLIHSIGVSIETDNPDEKVRFVYEIYNKLGPGEGTQLSVDLVGDGVERRVIFSEVDWKDEDTEPGQIRFEFATPELLGNACVKIYLNDGYDAPEVFDEVAVDTTTEAYKEMIKKSLLKVGNTARIVKAIKKAQAGEEVTIACIGGSITQGAGATPINTECYARKIYNHFVNKFAVADNVKYVKAGVGGTPSEVGMIRYDRDVTKDGEIEPDIVVVEFSVNDAGDETEGKCYESLVRKILKAPNGPAVINLFAVFSYDYNLRERLIPICENLDLPIIDCKSAVTPQFYNKPEERLITKNQYFYDVYHPTNLGHTVMADCVGNYFDEILNKYLSDESLMEDNTLEMLAKPAAVGAEFDTVKCLDKEHPYSKAVISEGSFTQSDPVLHCVERNMDLFVSPEFPYGWQYDGSKDNANPVFTLDIECKALFLVGKDTGDMKYAKLDCFVDGKLIRTFNPKDAGWTHLNAMLLINEEKAAKHHVELKIASGDEAEKVTVLGFGYCE